MSLQNDYVFIKLDENGIWAEDSTDVYNGTSFYSVTKRGINKVKDIVHEKFNSDTKYTDITEILRQNNIQYHTYCAVD